MADDMGLGKTMQMLSLQLLHPMPTLVVCPKTVLSSWLNDALKAFRPVSEDRPATWGQLSTTCHASV